MINQDILQIIQTIIYAVIAGIFAMVSKRVKPMIENKIAGQKNRQLMQYEQMAFGWAKNVVVPLAVNAALGTAEKRQLAIQKLSSKLDKFGIDLPESTIAGLVERAYQDYKANGGQVNYLTDNIDMNQAQKAEEAAKDMDKNSNDQGTEQSEPVNPYQNQGNGSDDNA